MGGCRGVWEGIEMGMRRREGEEWKRRGGLRWKERRKEVGEVGEGEKRARGEGRGWKGFVANEGKESI